MGRRPKTLRWGVHETASLLFICHLESSGVEAYFHAQVSTLPLKAVDSGAVGKFGGFPQREWVMKRACGEGYDEFQCEQTSTNRDLMFYCWKLNRFVKLNIMRVAPVREARRYDRLRSRTGALRLVSKKTLHIVHSIGVPSLQT